MLSSRDIFNTDSFRIEPFLIENVQPASIDVRLGEQLQIHHPSSKPLDPHNPDLENVTAHTLGKGKTFLLCPGQFVLGHTIEQVTLGLDVVARLEGKSSLARLGLVPHVAAGFIDPGFSGQITLELKNMGARPIVLRAGMFIGQLCFSRLDTPCVLGYGHPVYSSRYNGQMGAQVSKGISPSEA